ncbi:uncharacterized protein LOC136077858 [Hydra vulgaris]|uniref:Uncharacterized protein LOC136077858 n=1 Tax=Hydra vulgaris TaxID=6087 RepID=A0ABM4BGH0_HYDVU
MGKVADPSPRKRGKVEALLKLETFSQREIAKRCGLSKTAVFTIKKRLDFGFTSSPRRSTSGRKPVMTPRARRVLLANVRKNRRMTSKQLQGVLQEHQINVSTSCVRRWLIQDGFVARRPRKKPLLTNATAAMGHGSQRLDHRTMEKGLL